MLSGHKCLLAAISITWTAGHVVRRGGKDAHALLRLLVLEFVGLTARNDAIAATSPA